MNEAKEALEKMKHIVYQDIPSQSYKSMIELQKLVAVLDVYFKGLEEGKV